MQLRASNRQQAPRFRAYWRNVHGPFAATSRVMHRYEQNNLAPSTYEKGVAPAYDGLAITWFASTADMKRGTATPNMRWPAPTSARRPPAHHRHR